MGKARGERSNITSQFEPSTSVAWHIQVAEALFCLDGSAFDIISHMSRLVMMVRHVDQVKVCFKMFQPLVFCQLILFAKLAM